MDGLVGSGFLLVLKCKGKSLVWPGAPSGESTTSVCEVFFNYFQ